MAKLLFNVTWEEGTPLLKDVCEKYGFEPHELDETFGVIEIDPQDHLYTILVEQEAAQRVSDAYNSEHSEPGLEGPFSNPRIEPLGPPEE